jgi:type VI secretion system protein ImpB
MGQSSQKFIARNRAARVQIEYDVEIYGAEKKIQLPFVMGVLAISQVGQRRRFPPLPIANSSTSTSDNFESG